MIFLFSGFCASPPPSRSPARPRSSRRNGPRCLATHACAQCSRGTVQVKSSFATTPEKDWTVGVAALNLMVTRSSAPAFAGAAFADGDRKGYRPVAAQHAREIRRICHVIPTELTPLLAPRQAL